MAIRPGSDYRKEFPNYSLFTHEFIYDYLVERQSCGVPTNNFRALRAGYNMFASGHVQSVKLATSWNYIFYKSSIFPSMKKNKPYTTTCTINGIARKIVRAQCTCPAGASESCVHVSALLHALECLFESQRNTRLAAFAAGESRTSQECIWLKPRARKVTPTCATDLMYAKQAFGKKSSNALLYYARIFHYYAILLFSRN